MTAAATVKDYIEEFVEINGIRQYFLHVPSEGKPVILHLHGGPGQSQAHFAYCTRAQRDYCTFVYYDQRGAGKTQQKSKTPVGEVTLDNLIEDLRQTIVYVKERYQTDEVVLLGHSWGSVLGTSYILRYPNDVKGYIGVGQVVNMQKGERLGYEKLKETVENKGNRRDIKRVEGLSGYFTDIGLKDFMRQIGQIRSLQGKYDLAAKTPRTLKTVLKSPIFRAGDIASFLTAFQVNKNLFDGLLGYDILSVNDYQTPVCYVLGEKDWLVPSVLAAEYFETIDAPVKQLHWVKNAGHLTDLDNPQGFHEAVSACMQALCTCVSQQTSG